MGPSVQRQRRGQRLLRRASATRASNSNSIWAAAWAVFQAPEQKRLGRAPRPRESVRVGRDRANGVHEEGGQRAVYAIANQSADAPRVIALPDRIRRKCHVSGPARNRAGWQQHRVANGFIASAPPVEHPSEHRHVDVGVVVDAHLALGIVQPVQSTGVLGHRAGPRHGKCQEQRVQPCIVEPLTHVLAGRQHHPALLGGNRRQSFGHGGPRRTR